MRHQTKYQRRTAQRTQRVRPNAVRKTKTKPVQYPDAAFDRVPQAQITLTRETCWLTRFDAHGNPNTTYPVRASDVARAFNVFNASTGLLPPDVLFWTQAQIQTRLGIWLPPAVRALHFEVKRAETVRVPLPGFVFVGQGSKYWIYAASERPTNYGNALFHAPLPNVNNNGLICAGTVKFPVCAADTIHEAAKLFFESAFNLDLSVGKINFDTQDADDDGYGDPANEMYAGRFERNRPRRAQTLLQFLKSLTGDVEFPVAQLVPSNMNLQKVIGGKENE